MDDTVPLGSRAYFSFLAVLLLARGMDFLSTWVATPNLILEANPLVRRLGWRWSVPLNLASCTGFALWPLPAVIISTTSLLVAARNFEWAWLMRSMGEDPYRAWMGERLAATSPRLLLVSLLGQTLLVGAIGAALVWLTHGQFWGFAIGMGLLGYAVAVLFFSSLSLWRRRRRPF